MQVQPTSRRRYAAAPQSARDVSRVCQRVVRPQLLSGRSRYRLFLGAGRPGTPIFFNTKLMLKKMSIGHVSQNPPFARPSISLVPLLFSQKIHQRQWRAGENDRTTSTSSVSVRAYGGLDTLCPNCCKYTVQRCCLRCCKTPCEDDGVAGLAQTLQNNYSS